MACIKALRDSGKKDLTVVSNNCGVDDWGLGILLQTKYCWHCWHRPQVDDKNPFCLSSFKIDDRHSPSNYPGYTIRQLLASIATYNYLQTNQTYDLILCRGERRIRETIPGRFTRMIATRFVYQIQSNPLERFEGAT